MQFYHSQWEIRNDSAHSTASVGRDSDSATTLAEKDSAAPQLAPVPVAQVPGTPNREVVELGGRPANRAVVCG
jgi:hypothetical protein